MTNYFLPEFSLVWIVFQIINRCAPNVESTLVQLITQRFLGAAKNFIEGGRNGYLQTAATDAVGDAAEALLGIGWSQSDKRIVSILAKDAKSIFSPDSDSFPAPIVTALLFPDVSALRLALDGRIKQWLELRKTQLPKEPTMSAEGFARLSSELPPRVLEHFNHLLQDPEHLQAWEGFVRDVIRDTNARVRTIEELTVSQKSSLETMTGQLARNELPLAAITEMTGRYAADIESLLKEVGEVKTAVQQESDNIRQIYDWVQYLVDEQREGATTPTPAPAPKTGASKPLTARHLEIERQYLLWVKSTNQFIDYHDFTREMRLQLPLDRVFVALRGARVDAVERESSRQLLEMQVADFETAAREQGVSPLEITIRKWRLLGRAPTMAYGFELNRPLNVNEREQERLSLGDAFMRDRRLAILGDPGSGKTTIVRWLAFKLADARLRGNKQLRVPAQNLDPEEDHDNPVSLGKARLPIPVRIADFATARRSDEQLALIEFLGTEKHVWMGLAPSYMDSRAGVKGTRLPIEELRDVFISRLDTGDAMIILDGLDEISTEDDRLNIVQAIESFIRDYVAPESKRSAELKSQGNRIVVTSRIAGYRAAALVGDVAHVMIEPMSDRAVDRFCETWTDSAIRAEMGDSVEIARIALERATTLKSAIHDPNRPGIRELAGNPLLLTVLATLFQEGGTALPEQRVELYQLVIDDLSRRWLDRISLTSHDLMFVMGRLATYIHDQHVTGLIEFTEAEAQVKQALKELRKGIDDAQLEQDIKSFLRILPDDVGLLAARGKRLYGFLHLTFEEYLAALDLIEDREDAAARLVAKLGNPRWREPLLLSIGYISVHWDSAAREHIYRQLLQQQDGMEDLLPRGAMLLAHALREMPTLPSKAILSESIIRLLTAYCDRERIGRFASLQSAILTALRSFRQGAAGGVLDEVLVGWLQSAPAEPTRVLGAADVIRRLRFETKTIVDALYRALPYDDQSWEFPIDRALREIARRSPHLIEGRHLRMRELLRVRSELVAPIVVNHHWMRVIVALYGGLSPVSAGNSGQNAQYAFSVESIHRDTHLTDAIAIALREGVSVAEFSKQLDLRFKNSANSQERLEVLIGLTAAGVDVSEHIELERARGENLGRFLAYLTLIGEVLKPAIYSITGSITDEFEKLVGIDDEARLDLLSSLQAFLMDNTDDPPDPIDLGFGMSEHLSVEFYAQYWSYLFARPSADPVYTIQYVINIFGEKLASSPEELCWSLALARQNPQPNTYVWAPEPFPLVPRTDREALIETMAGLASTLPEFAHLRGWVLLELANNLHLDPDLIPEAVCIATEFTDNSYDLEVLATLAPELENNPDLASELAKRIERIADPADKARALWRSMSLYSRSEAVQIWTQATSVAEDIIDHAQRSQMFWRLAQESPAVNSAVELVAKSVAAAQKIDSTLEPDAFIRSFARILPLLRADARYSWLKIILETVPKITDERARARTLAKLRPSLAGYPDLSREADQMSLAMQTTWAQFVAQEALAPQLLQSLNVDSAPTVWAPIVLLALVNELRDRIDVPSNVPDQWEALLDPNRHEATMVTLERNGRIQALRLTSAAARIIDVLLNEGAVETVERLLPNVSRPEVGAEATIRKWLGNSNTQVKHHAALLLSELGEVNLEIFQLVVTLLSHEDDRTRYRAALTLYDRRVSNALRSSLMGAETIEWSDKHLAELYRVNDRHASFVNQILRWFGNKMLADDGAAIEHWATEAVLRQNQAALMCFSRMNLVDRGGWRGLLRGLAIFAGGSRDQRCISLRTLLYILYGTSYFPEYAIAALRAHLYAAIQDVDPAIAQWGLSAITFLKTLNEQDMAVIHSKIDDGGETGAQAVLALGTLHYEDNEEVLLPLLDHSDPHVSRAADAMFIRNCARTDLGRASEIQLLGVFQKIDTAFGSQPQRFLSALLLAAESRWYGEFETRIERIGGIAIRHYPDLLAPVVEELISVLTTPDLALDFTERVLNDKKWMREGALFGIMAAGAAERPHLFARTADPDRILSLLVREAISNRLFTSRQAALTCLGYLRQVNLEVAAAVRSGLRDVAEVQQVALTTLVRFRDVPSGLIKELAVGLKDSSAAAAYATARLLATVGQAPHTPTADRIAVLAELGGALFLPESRREVYVLDQGPLVRHLGRLDDLIYQMIVQISGFDIGDDFVSTTRSAMA